MTLLPRLDTTRLPDGTPINLTIDHRTTTGSEQATRDAVLQFAQDATLEQWMDLRFWARHAANASDPYEQEACVASFDAALHDIVPREADWPDTRIYVPADDIAALHDAIDAAVTRTVIPLRRTA